MGEHELNERIRTYIDMQIHMHNYNIPTNWIMVFEHASLRACVDVCSKALVFSHKL